MTRRMLHALPLLATSMLAGCADADRDLPSGYRRLAVPEARLSSTEGLTRGRALFLEHCALCHGTRGDGHGERTEGLTRSPRDFTSAAWRQSTSPRRVFFAIREGLSGTAMPQWRSLSEQDAWDLTAYVLSVAGNPR